MNTVADSVESLHAEPVIQSETESTGPELRDGILQPISAKRKEVGGCGAPDSLLFASTRVSARWNPEEFARQQMVSLVQRIFFPGWPRPARQVVFSAVDGTADSGATCAEISIVMAERLPGTVCAVETEPEGSTLCTALAGRRKPEIVGLTKSLNNGRPVHSNLWLLTAEDFFCQYRPGAAWLRNRLGELRRAFDYLAIHAPEVASRSETALAGQMTDGVILVLNEQDTRRAAAQQAKEILLSANARLLGVVLSERQFPIPEDIYRRL